MECGVSGVSVSISCPGVVPSVKPVQLKKKTVVCVSKEFESVVP